MITDIRKIVFLLVLISGLLACSRESGDGPTPPVGKVLAFPGADGGGRYVTGGQGAVYML